MPAEEVVKMLLEKLKNYSQGGIYPMHMPGHKRNTGLLSSVLPYDIDITEICGFDDLHDPHGVLLETAELAASLYGSDKAFMLVGGSTVGILAAIGAHTTRGDSILIAGKCHRSVLNAASLFGLTPISIVPKTDEASGVDLSIDPSDVESALNQHTGISLVVATSPSYEGIVNDINAIADAAHKRGIPLLVDSAHGAHLGFSQYFPTGAVRAGADIVVMSLHKTLPALTQCSLLHVSGKLAAPEEIARLLSVLQTSSPSYVLMASIDNCLRFLASGADRLFREYEKNLERFDKEIASLKNLFVLFRGSGKINPCIFAFDPGKLVLVTKNTAITGFELAGILRNEHKIELERACADHALAMTGVCDTSEGFNRLAKALLNVDNEIS